ncbi:MAG: hypothetical protein ACLPZR_28100 [Solirubrobacteraceae bacterium]
MGGSANIGWILRRLVIGMVVAAALSVGGMLVFQDRAAGATRRTGEGLRSSSVSAAGLRAQTRSVASRERARNSPGGPGGTAGCTNVDVINGSSFNYNLCGLPDLDQHRKADPATGIVGLPDSGAAWCAPTAVMDAFAYFASHGLASLAPGNEDWTLASNYNPMTEDLISLGADMGTLPVGGTTGAGEQKGIATWVGRLPMVAITLSDNGVGGTDAPTLLQMATAAAAGGVVIPHLTFLSKPAPGSSSWTVDEGHFVTMSSASSPSTIGLHDPATPTTRLAYQAPYTQQTYKLTPIHLTYVEKHGTSKTGTFLRIDHYRLSASFNEKHRTVIITSFTLIEPETVSFWGAPASTIGLVQGFGATPARAFDAAGGQSVIDLAPDPLDFTDLYTTHSSQTIWSLNPANGVSTPFAAAAAQPQLVAFADASQTVFVSTASGLSAYDSAGLLETSAATTAPPDSLAVDQSTGDLLALHAATDTLQVFNARLALIDTIPVAPGLLAGTGPISLIDQNRTLYIHRDDQASIALAHIQTYAPGQTPSWRVVELADGQGSSGLAVNNIGQMFVQSSAGDLVVYGPAGRLLSSSQFSGRAIGPQLAVTTSYSSPALASLLVDTPIS